MNLADLMLILFECPWCAATQFVNYRACFLGTPRTFKQDQHQIHSSTYLGTRHLAAHQVLPCTRSLRQRVDGCDKVWLVGETRMSLTTQRLVTGITSQVTDSQLASASESEQIVELRTTAMP